MFTMGPQDRGAAQRVQEDTIKFSASWKVWHQSNRVDYDPRAVYPYPVWPVDRIPIFFFGDWEYGLIAGALIWSVGGTVFLVALISDWLKTSMICRRRKLPTESCW